MFEYSKGRFVQPSRIVGASIYNKQNGTSEKDGSAIIEIRVAIEIDVANREQNALFAGPFESEAKATEFIMSIPTGKTK